MWYIGQGEVYIGQNVIGLRSLKYGAKSPQMVHWARWQSGELHWEATKFKIWCKASSGDTLGNVS